MTLHGLFIGVDRYAAPVSRLSCAVADATALAALFEDNFGGNVTRLLDQDATRQGILDGLETLTTSDHDDIVVISFSGHGTPGHALVPIDVDPAEPADTSVHLDDLAALIDKIPAQRLLVALDCCFSGGFGGARVFAPTQTRTMTEDRDTLDRIGSGVGRVVVTACAAGELAMETLDTGHGLLTDAILRGLQGHGPVDSEMLGLLTTLEWVIGEVGIMAGRIGEEQTPTIYGSFEGWTRWPVFEPGDAYAAAFPGKVLPPATEAWRSLEPQGLPETVLSTWEERFPGLNDLQLDAINGHGVLTGQSVVVVAPTGSGKTLIGELAAIQAAFKGGRSLFLLPQRALVNDKYEDFTRTYADLLTVVRATGEYGDQVGEILSGHYDIALLTYEKFLSLAIANRHLTRAVSTVVIDELQMISDPNRGATVEFLLTMLRSGYGRGTPPQIVGLSAVIGETHDIARWLGGTLLRTETRPVPLSEGVLDSRGSLRVLQADGTEELVDSFIQPQFIGGGEGTKHLMIPLVAKLVGEGKKVIVFRSTKGRTVGTAGYLANNLGLPAARAVLDSLPDQDASDASDRLRDALHGGIAFHNADLDRDERTAIEEAFRDPNSDLRVVVATTTLAMGINTPADAVVIGELTFPGATPQPFAVAEYKNMVGRAGRPGFTEAGEAYIIATTDVGPAVAWDRYVLGAPEAIASRLRDQASDPQTLVVRTLAVLGEGVDRDGLLSFLNSSFAVWEAEALGNRDGWSTAELEQAVEGLQTAGLIRVAQDGIATLTELGRYAGESGVEVQSITRLAAAIDATEATLTAADVITLAQVTVELDEMYIPWHRRSNKERARWPNTLRHFGAQAAAINALTIAGDLTPRSKKAAAAFLFATAEPMADIEANLMQHVRDRSAAGPIRQVANRTRDLLDAVLTVATLKGKLSPVELEILEKLAIRLEIGLPEDIVPVAEVYGAGLNRGQYLALREAGVTNVEQAAKAHDDLLEGIVLEGDVKWFRETAIAHVDG